jgi:hypothetical protein
MTPLKRPVPPRGKSRFRQADLAKAIRSAEAAGFKIGGVEVARDGTIRILPKSAEPADTPENIIKRL